MTMKTERFEMRTSTEFARVIDQWRRNQESIPSRSDAVRTLVSQGLMYETLDEAVKNMLDVILDASKKNKISEELALSIINKLEPHIMEVEEYADTLRRETQDLREIVKMLMKFKENNPEEFAKSPFAAKTDKPRIKKPTSPKKE